MSFAGTWMNLEVIIGNEVRQSQISHDINYMWNVKNRGTNKLIYKTEIESQMQKTNFWLPREMLGRDKSGDWD